MTTAGDLLRADLDTLLRQLEAPPAARGVLIGYRRAIRLASSVPGLAPHEARLLISIHRRSPATIAAESPGLLHRDLQRFALSSRGKKQLRGAELPSPARVRAIVRAAAQQRAAAAPRAAVA